MDVRRSNSQPSGYFRRSKSRSVERVASRVTLPPSATPLLAGRVMRVPPVPLRPLPASAANKKSQTSPTSGGEVENESPHTQSNNGGGHHTTLHDDTKVNRGQYCLFGLHITINLCEQQNNS
jgi:hypothetical protein